FLDIQLSIHKYKTFCDFISHSIDEFLSFNQNEDTSYSLLWESLKAFLRGQIISYSSYSNKKHKTRLSELLVAIGNLDQECASDPFPELFKKRLDLQTEFDLISSKSAEQMLLLTRTFYEHDDKANRLLAHQCLTTGKRLNSIQYLLYCYICRWNNLPLSLIGKINVIKMNVLPKFLFLFQSIPLFLPKYFFDSLDKMISSFIWCTKPVRIKLVTLQHPILSGGLATLHTWVSPQSKVSWRVIEADKVRPHRLQDILFAGTGNKNDKYKFGSVVAKNVVCWFYSCKEDNNTKLVYSEHVCKNILDT
uniref:Uncharacterized protein n=1 Tax=Cyprinus carpio carpio TaxID=630221 RepID=A0A9J8DJL7_CYPCA